MTDWANTAAALKAVRAREKEFLARFVAECLFDRSIFLDGVLADLQQSDERTSSETNRNSLHGGRDRGEEFWSS